MSEISDELLMAYVDGELTQAERRQVDAYLAATPGAAARLQDFAATGRALATLFDVPTPMPARLLQTVLQTELQSEVDAEVAPARSSLTKPARATPRRRLSASLAALRTAASPWQGASPWRGAMMFGSGMLVAGAIGWALHAPQPAPASLAALMELSTTGLRAANGLDRALETLPSRKLEFTAATAANPVVANPIMAPELTFMHVDGRLCRQFAIQQAAAQRFAGVACRTATKQWRIEIFAQADEPAAARGAIAPAGKPSAVIDGAIDRMIDGDPLDAAGEAKLITNDWRTDSK